MATRQEILHRIGKTAEFIAYMIMVIAVSKLIVIVIGSCFMVWAIAAYILKEIGTKAHTMDLLFYAMRWNFFYIVVGLSSLILYLFFRNKTRSKDSLK